MLDLLEKANIISYVLSGRS